MRFAAYLNAHMPFQRVAELFVEDLLRRTEETLEVAVQFVSSNLTLIGFQCDITPQQVKTGTYKWPENLRVYNFPYNDLLFDPFEKFLRHISNVILEKQYLFDSGSCNLSQSSESSLPSSPIFYMLELLGVWQRVYTDLEQQECNLLSLRFEEPIARINLNLLMGLHAVRKQYRLDYPHLDTACHRLYSSAIRGVFYTQLHVQLVADLSTLFSQDFDLFHNHSVDSMDFFYETLTVLNQTHTYIKIFEILEQMLSKPSWTQGQLLILTNYLIEEKMQEIYFTYIKCGKSKRLLLRILKFLKILQSKLPSVECFSKAFIEVLWILLLKNDKQISSLAADTYIAIMERKFDNTFILNHILEGYFQKQNSPESLKYYIETLWQSFPHMHNVDVYIKVITTTQTTEIFRAYTGHFLVEVYKQMQKNYVKYTQTLVQLLLQLPQLLKELSCQITVGILMQIYAASNFDDIKRYAPEKFLEISLTFEAYAIICFTKATCEYPVMLCIFTQLNRCFYHTHNWPKLERIACNIYSQFREMENKLNNKKIKTQIIKNYNIVLQQLSILLQTGYNLFDHLADILKCVQARLIDEQQIYEFVSKEKSFHDVYAIEILTFGLRKLAATAEYGSEELLVKKGVEILSKHIFNILRNIKDPSKMCLLRIKTLYCSYIQLHCVFYEKLQFPQMNLTATAYPILVEILILINFNTKSFLEDGDDGLQYHSFRNLEYQKMMFDEFIRLHNTETFKIPSNVAWKLCMYFGLPDHKFHDNLAELLKVIANKHLNMYKHILPVLVFNLNNKKPPINRHIIQKSLKFHNDFIASQLKEQNPCALKVHILLTVLQIVKKNVEVKVALKSEVNRLVALKHLNVLVADLEWTDKTVLELIIEKAEEIQNNLLTPDEKNDLLKFIQYFRKYL